ncbi:MAG: transcription elongation factor GreA [Bacteroidales bacterium]|nr:transcription elongation factor GreA [Bacteroidales bacterium]
MGKVNYLTEDGIKKLKEEIEYLKSVERLKISKQIAEARDKGDLSENAEYDAAKEAQGLLELKISKIEEIFANSRIIDESKLDFSKVQILSKVKMKNKKNNAIMEYSIVAESEADFKSGKISINTPIAKGLLGKKVGDVVNIKVPSGTVSFEIIEISKY